MLSLLRLDTCSHWLKLNSIYSFNIFSSVLWRKVLIFSIAWFTFHRGENQKLFSQSIQAHDATLLTAWCYLKNICLTTLFSVHQNIISHPSVPLGQVFCAYWSRFDDFDLYQSVLWFPCSCIHTSQSQTELLNDVVCILELQLHDSSPFKAF